MSFLAPLFLLGAAAIALPIVFHLIRQTTRERIPFSSLMFLSPTPPRLTRRSRLENLLLLVLRAGVLALLAFGFARPFLKRAEPNSPAAGGVHHAILLVDASASMQRSGMWEQARQKAISVLRELPQESLVAVYSFDRRVRGILTFDEWRQAPLNGRVALARQKLEELKPGWGPTQAGQALMHAAELLADAGARSTTASSEIVLVSDLQEGARFDSIQGYEWPRNVRIRVETLSPSKTSNAALALLAQSGENGAGTNAAYRLRASNAADSRREHFKIGWAQNNSAEFAGPPMEIHLPPGQSRTFPLPSPTPPGATRLILHGDEEPFDNQVAVAPLDPAQARVLYFGSDSENEPRGQLYFLRRALQDTRTRRIELLTNAPAAPLSPENLQHASFIVLSEVVPPAKTEQIRGRLNQGMTALVPVRDPAHAGTISALLAENRTITAEEAVVNNYALLADIEFRHPLFAPFADPRYADFTKVRFWRYRKLGLDRVPEAKVLARFDSGDPAVVQASVGKGSLIILASGWHTGDSQLALSTKFVPLLYTLLQQSGAPPPPPQFFVGDAIPLGGMFGADTELTVTGPDGAETKVGSGKSDYPNTSLPGVYTVRFANTSARFVVNLDPAESRLLPLSLDELERLGAPLSPGAELVVSEAARRERLRNSELESRQKMWRWLIVGALAVLLAETWLAGRSARPMAKLGSAQA